MSKISADNISNKDDTKEIPTDTVIAGSAKAWVNFNGTGVVAINDSFNVSSITDNGTGDYTVNFTSAISNANYSFSGSALQGIIVNYKLAASPTINNFPLILINHAGVVQDSEITTLSIHAN